MTMLWYPPQPPAPPPAEKHELSLAAPTCPVCDGPSTLERTGEETCLGWLGPHNPNCIGGTWVCQSGHRFAATSQYMCSCGWSNVKVCTISNHHKKRVLK